MNRKTSFLALILLSFFSFIPAFAQFETASVLGYIRDASGAAIANSTVTLTNQATGISSVAKSNSEGRYDFVSVAPGSYIVSTEAPGFDKADTAVFQVTTNARQRVDVAMKTGSVNETVTVSAAATLLETETSSRGQVIGTRQIEDLPLNGRSYADLALLAPGVRKSVLENQSNTSREASFNINGQRSAFNNFLLDGLDNNTYGTSNQGFANENIPPSPDAVGEFRIETNNYSAEYGRSSGGVINASIRRGSNQFHGRAWDYIRNTKLNAIGPFSPPNHVKPVLIRNQFGGTFGGPILRDKAFFFADYEGLREIDKAYTTASIPTASQRAGVFQYINAEGNLMPIPLRNPLTGKVYEDGVIPTSDYSPLAQLVFDALPTPTSATTAGKAASSNYTSLPRATIDDKKGDGRVDYTINPRLVVFGRYSQHRADLFVPGNIPGPAGGNNNGNVLISNKNIAMGLTYSLNSTSILDVRFGIGYNQGGKSPIGVGQPSLLTQAGITNGLPTDPSIVRPLNAQSLNGFSQLGDQGSNPQFQNPTVYNPKLNYTLIRGIHSLKLGYEFQSISTSINDFNPTYGQDNYTGKFSALGATISGSSAIVAAGNQAYSTADFIFGLRSSYQLNNFRIVKLQQRMNFFYAQDDIKVSPRLTINAGLRYELASPQWVDGNHLANFDPATATLQQAKSGSIYDRALVHQQYNNLAPRFGLAYSADDKTVIRSGFGLTYTQFNREGGENLLAYNGPYIVNASIDQSSKTLLANPCTSDTQDQTKCFRTTQQGYSTNLVAPEAFNPLKAQARYIPRNNPVGYVENYFLGVQRQIGNSMIVDVSYVGSHGVHLMILGDFNQASVCATTTGCPSLQARRPIPNFAAIEVAFGGGGSNYNALQAKFEKRFSHGLYILNSFTWSRGFDNAGGHLETAGGDNSRVNIANIGGDYGPSGYDQPLNNTTSIIYDLPIFNKSKGLLKTFGGGWQFTNISTLTSGLPANLNYNVNGSYSVTGLYTYRPNVIGDLVLAHDLQTRTASGSISYLDPAGVQAPTSSNPFGNASRNSIRGPKFSQTDMGLHKGFQLFREGSLLDFRAEVFNIFNESNFYQPDTNVSNGTYGTITQAYPARQIQFAAKLIF